VIAELFDARRRRRREHRGRSLIVSGGVACNSGLRAAAQAAALPYPVYFPSVGLSTDNAAMIAAAAFPSWRAAISPRSTSPPKPTSRWHERHSAASAWRSAPWRSAIRSMRMLSWARVARPHPRRPGPSSVGTPRAAVKIAVDPPRLRFLQLDPHFARQYPRRAEQTRNLPERSIGGRFRPPLTSTVHRESYGFSSRNFFSSAVASCRRPTRISISALASAGHYIGARAPRNHPRIDGDAALQVDEPGDAADLPRQFHHRAGARLKVHARVRGPSAYSNGKKRPRPCAPF